MDNRGFTTNDTAKLYDHVLDDFETELQSFCVPNSSASHCSEKCLVDPTEDIEAILQPYLVSNGLIIRHKDGSIEIQNDDVHDDTLPESKNNNKTSAVTKIQEKDTDKHVCNSRKRGPTEIAAHNHSLKRSREMHEKPDDKFVDPIIEFEEVLQSTLVFLENKDKEESNNPPKSMGCLPPSLHNNPTSNSNQTNIENQPINFINLDQFMQELEIVLNQPEFENVVTEIEDNPNSIPPNAQNLNLLTLEQLELEMKYAHKNAVSNIENNPKPTSATSQNENFLTLEQLKFELEFTHNLTHNWCVSQKEKLGEDKKVVVRNEGLNADVEEVLTVDDEINKILTNNVGDLNLSSVEGLDISALVSLVEEDDHNASVSDNERTDSDSDSPKYQTSLKSRRNSKLKKEVLSSILKSTKSNKTPNSSKCKTEQMLLGPKQSINKRPKLPVVESSECDVYETDSDDELTEDEKRKYQLLLKKYQNLSSNIDKPHSSTSMEQKIPGQKTRMRNGPKLKHITDNNNNLSVRNLATSSNMIIRTKLNTINRTNCKKDKTQYLPSQYYCPFKKSKRDVQFSTQNSLQTNNQTLKFSNSQTVTKSNKASKTNPPKCKKAPKQNTPPNIQTPKQDTKNSKSKPLHVSTQNTTPPCMKITNEKIIKQYTVEEFSKSKNQRPGNNQRLCLNKTRSLQKFMRNSNSVNDENVAPNFQVSIHKSKSLTKDCYFYGNEDFDEGSSHEKEVKMNAVIAKLVRGHHSSEKVATEKTEKVAMEKIVSSRKVMKGEKAAIDVQAEYYPHLIGLHNFIMERLQIIKHYQLKSVHKMVYAKQGKHATETLLETITSSQEEYEKLLESQELLSQEAVNFTPDFINLSQGQPAGLDDIFTDTSLINHDGAQEINIPSEIRARNVLQKIAQVFEGIVQDIRAGLVPELKAQGRVTWENVIFCNNRLVLRPPLQTKNIHIKYIKMYSRNRFELIVKLMGKIVDLILANMTCTIRELYYQLVNFNFLSDKRQVDNALNVISGLIDTPTWEFRVFASSKGLVYGNLLLHFACGDVISAAHSGGIVIPHNLQDIRKIETNASFILIVEKDSVFRALLAEDLPNKLDHPFLVVTGKGYSDILTRLFVRKVWQAAAIPIFALVDCDPFGIEIMLTYRFGSLAQAHLSDYLAIPQLRWLGLHPSELVKMGAETLELGPRDKAKLDNLLSRPYIDSVPKIREELEILKARGVKSEIEGVLQSFKFLHKFYLPNKLCDKDYI